MTNENERAKDGICISLLLVCLVDVILMLLLLLEDLLSLNTNQ